MNSEKNKNISEVVVLLSSKIIYEFLAKLPFHCLRVEKAKNVWTFNKPQFWVGSYCSKVWGHCAIIGCNGLFEVRQYIGVLEWRVRRYRETVIGSQSVFISEERKKERRKFFSINDGWRIFEAPSSVIRTSTNWIRGEITLVLFWWEGTEKLIWKSSLNIVLSWTPPAPRVPWSLVWNWSKTLMKI